MSQSPIYVTRPYLPPIDEFLPLLNEIWEGRWLSNQGPFHQRFEDALGRYLEAEHVSLTANGMLALEMAVDASDLSGEIITTPYSFVATTHAIKRSGLTPVFVDIRPSDLNIDPDRIEAAITDRTSAIVAVHCYGNPCDTEALQAIAERHGLKLIYDAAHAFGVRRDGRTILTNGDFSILSFHATKAFNTFEGGAVIAATASGKATVDSGRNFGIADEVTIPAVGGNAKMSEFNAALGLLQLHHFDDAREARRKVDARYRERLAGVAGIELIATQPKVDPNYSYFPVLVTEEYPISRDALYDELKAHGIYSRRYFYPLLSSLPMYRDLPSAARENLPVATRTAEQILCLPIYSDLPETDQDRVVEMVRR
jgi:dTDP-4-amino-4,6-dideoxygalactose transaminase